MIIRDVPENFTPAVCSKCGQMTERIIQMPLLDGSGRTVDKVVGIMCRCREEELEARKKKEEQEDKMRRIQTLRRMSLITEDATIAGARFRNFRVDDGNSSIAKIMQRYVLQFKTMLERNQGLLFYGDVGTGKSYAAAAIANELLYREVPVIMTSFVKILNEIMKFEKDSSIYSEKLNAADLLVIDDLGVERSTDFSLEKVYDVIDSRYRSGKPIIITTNLDVGQMKNCMDIRYNRIYDRIFEMCYPVRFDGTAWRKKKSVSKFDEMKKLLEGER